MATLARSIYGLGLEADVAITGLKGLRVPDRIDVSLALGRMPPDLDGMPEPSAADFYVSDDRDERGVPGVKVARLAGGAYFRIAYADGTRIVVDSKASRIWATAPAGATVEDTATYLLGPALGFVLRLRGVTCLHASAVAIGGGAVAFVGAAGAGKSSTAAAFARLGYPVLTDDVAALEDFGDRFNVQPAYPRVRLWPDAVEALFGAPDALPRITPGWEKRYLALDNAHHRFQASPLELRAVYLLGERAEEGGATRVEAATGKSALMSLVAETYATRMIDAALRAREFELLGRLVEHVPVRP